MRQSVDHVNDVGEASADELLELVHDVMHLWRARQHPGAGADENGLTPLETRVLGFFSRHPGATQRDLVEHSGRDKGQIARLIAGLRERGLLDAHTDENDRRVACMTLTEPAKALLAAARRRRSRLAQAAVQGLDDAERRTLATLLRRLQANLDAAR